MDILEIDFFRVYNNIDNLKKNITIFLRVFKKFTNLKRTLGSPKRE